MKFEPVAALRPPFVYWTCLWACGLSVALVAAFYDAISPDPGVPLGRDFSNLYAAGRLAINDQAYRAFDVNMFRLALGDSTGALTLQNYSYPPQALFLAAPFALLPYGLSLVLFSLFGLGLFYWSARPYVSFAPALSILTPAAAICVWNGHYGLILGALWLVYFRLLKTHPVRAGLIASLMTFKPHMGLFIGLSALTNRRALFTAILGTLSLVFLSAWIFEPASWYGFIGETIQTQAAIASRQAHEFYFRLMPAAYTAYGRNGFSAAMQVITAISAIYMVVKHGKLDPFVLATATFLIVPYVFNYDMTVACLGFAVMLWRDWGVLSKWEKVALSAGFLCPATTMIFPYSQILSPPILLGALYVQTR